MSIDVTLGGIMLWGFVTSGLIIYSLICSLIYTQTRQRVFLYYGLYNMLVVLFILKNSPLISQEWVQSYINSKYYTFNWLIQVIYNSLLFFFYIEFLEMKTHFPKFSAFLSKFLKVLMIAATFWGIIAVAADNPRLFSLFFNFGFIPLMTVMVIAALWVTTKIPNNLKYFIISGVIIYQVLAYLSLLMSYRIISSSFPIFYFYLGVVIESTIFMLGLGYKIKLLYAEKLHAQQLIIEEQTNLQLLRNSQQLELERQLEQKITQLRLVIEQNEAEKLKSLALAYENEISQLRLDALRSQMNPHFIFNALNSIKAFLIDNNKEKAIYYLNKFAKLIRKILEGTRTDSVPLNDELETISLYLNIENIRFNDSVDFELSIDQGIDISTIRIPSLILQPFIENAFWHGLMQKEGLRRISIEVTGMSGEVKLSITDNGIGREKARDISEKKSFKKESLGILFAQDRLNYFNRKYNTKYSFTISDLYDDLHIATGTQVVFSFLMD
ncbi:MAG: histidine kinase [Lentimicrobium sp.]|nr:histidine kinase [Lentimicrobium sp.]